MIRRENRRGKRILVIDIHYTKKDGSKGRLRKDADVQATSAATAEERRYLDNIAQYGEPFEPKTETVEEKPVLTFGEVVKLFRESYMLTDLKLTTRRRYDQWLDNELLPRLSDRPIDEVGAEHAHQLDEDLTKRQLKPWTRRNGQVCLRSVLRFAEERGHLGVFPKMPPLKVIGQTILEIPSDDDVAKILQLACPAQRVPFALMVHAGLRPNEVRALLWRDVLVQYEGDEPTGGFLSIREGRSYGELHTPKSGTRQVPFARALAKVLAGLGTQARATHVALNSVGEPWGQTGLDQAFGRVRDRAGLSGWSIYALRHYAITNWLRRGIPSHVVQRMAGHSSLATTERYVHVVGGDLADAARRLA
jgi:integrase